MQSEKDLRAFIRWQRLSIEQFGYANNLILALAVTSLGFTVALLQRADFVPASWQKCVFTSALTSLSSSAAFGIWCVLNRLRDFSLTARIARRRGRSAEDPMTPLREEVARLGELSWHILRWQTATFGFGVVLVMAGVVGVLKTKLF